VLVDKPGIINRYLDFIGRGKLTEIPKHAVRQRVGLTAESIGKLGALTATYAGKEGPPVTGTILLDDGFGAVPDDRGNPASLVQGYEVLRKPRGSIGCVIQARIL